jgi:putative polyketide hydroxylase
MFGHLRRLPSASIRLGCQLLGVTQDDNGVRATVADAGTGAVEGITASYLIAADGAHSTIREQLGIAMAGPDDLADYEHVEFTAPLGQLAGEYRYALYLITRSDAARVLAPRRPGDRWSLSREVPAGSRGLAGLGQDDLTGLIQRAAGTSALRPQIERLGQPGTAGELRTRAGPVAAHNVRRSSEPAGARRETDETLPWDLSGRLPHHWLAGDQERSTVDLIGDGLTLLAGPSDPAGCASPGTSSRRHPLTST